jgi:hypothetical protein
MEAGGLGGHLVERLLLDARAQTDGEQDRAVRLNGLRRPNRVLVAAVTRRLLPVGEDPEDLLPARAGGCARGDGAAFERLVDVRQAAIVERVDLRVEDVDVGRQGDVDPR